MEPEKVSELHYSNYLETENYINFSVSDKEDLIKVHKNEIIEHCEDSVKYKKIKDGYIILWILSIILTLFISIPIFMSDDEVSWDFKDTLIETYKKRIKCHIEYQNGEEIFYYTLNGRLLAKTNHKLSVYNYEINSYIKDYIQYKKSLPLFKTKSEILEEIVK